MLPRSQGQRLSRFDEVTFSLMEHSLEEHLAGIFPEQEEEQLQEEGANALQTTAVRPAGKEGQALLEANARQHRWIAGAGRQSSARWSGGATREWQISGQVPPTRTPRRCNASRKV
jgi:hypothetical protein